MWQSHNVYARLGHYSYLIPHLVSYLTPHLGSYLIPHLPPNFKFIITTRPDAMRGSVRSTLTRYFGDSGVKFIDNPSALRASKDSSSEEGKVMVFDKA